MYPNKTVTKKKKKYGFYLTSTQQLPDFSPMHLSLILQTHLEGLVQLSRIGSWADSGGCPQPHPQHQWSLDAFLNCQLVLEAASSPRNQDASQERVVSDGGREKDESRLFGNPDPEAPDGPPNTWSKPSFTTKVDARLWALRL